MPSIGALDWHNSQARPTVKINLVPHAVLLMPLREHTGHKIHPHDLTALKKPPVKRTPVYLVSGLCMFSLSSKRISICDNKVSFPKYTVIYN